MANQKATLLNFEPLNASGMSNLEFSIPFANGIMIIAPEFLLFFKRPPFYGDEIDLTFWGLLGLPYGQAWQSGQILTLVAGHRYRYNHSTRVFEEYDENGRVLVHRGNIQSIADMGIDFTIVNSHQFEIVIDPNSVDLKFFLPAKWQQQPLDFALEDVVGRGVQNIYLADSERPYKADSSSNPTNDILYIGRVSNSYGNDEGNPPDGEDDVDGSYGHDGDESRAGCNNGGRGYDGENGAGWSTDTDGTGYLYRGAYESDILTGLYFDLALPWKFVCPVNKFYYANDILSPFQLEKIYEEATLTALSWKYLLPQLSIDLYPALMPIERAGETQNNRPVYEPWLIWGMIQFMANRTRDKSDDEFPIPVFDLSPWWS